MLQSDAEPKKSAANGIVATDAARLTATAPQSRRPTYVAIPTIRRRAASFRFSMPAVIFSRRPALASGTPHSTMAATAVNDMRNPASKRYRASNSSITQAVSARAFNVSNLTFSPIESCNTVNMIAARVTLGEKPVTAA